jgi:type II secretory pathway component GspD/PulD (secretin)
VQTVVGLALAGSLLWAQEPVATAVTDAAPQAQTAVTAAAAGHSDAAQSAPAQPATVQNAPGATGTGEVLKKPAKPPTGNERRRAAKLYLEAAKLFERGQFEEALKDDQQAAALDPTNPNYLLSAEVARGHAVTALIQRAAKDRMAGDDAGARAALTHAMDLDPHNPDVNQHLSELGYDNPEPAVVPNDQSGEQLGGLEQLQPSAEKHSFHLRSNQRQLVQQVFKEYGIQATVDDSVRSTPVKFDVEDATFAQAAESVSLVTNSFYVPIDPHRALVARDTRENRQQFTRNGEETIYLSGMTTNEMTDVTNMARNVFEMSQAAVNQSAGTLTVRAPESKLKAFNATVQSLMDGRSQVLLDIRLIQLAHSNQRNTGAQPPQQVTAFDVYTEEQSILNANQSLVQQIISSGLAAPGDTLTILGILLASGQVSSSLFQNGVVLFGGGLTLSGLSPGPTTINLSLNSSDSRELDRYQLRLEDGEEGTLRSGTRYPIESSQFSSLGSNSLNIPGLTSAGNSSNLSSILSSLQGTSTTIPQVQYQDLGLTLKARPSVMRSGDVAVNIDMKISALAGSSVNGLPVLANRAWSGVVTMGRDHAVVVASEMDKQESRAISGFPGLSEIPGMNNITDKDVQKSTSTLLIVITPQVVRGPRAANHTHLVRIERGQVR